MARNKKQLPLLEKVTITDVAAEGKAIARVNDKVIFVPFVAPGDIVDIQITRKKSSFAEGRLYGSTSTQRNVPLLFANISVFAAVANGNISPTRNS